MLANLINTHIKEYRKQIVLIVVLQLVAQAASLYIPTMNARIIDQGILDNNPNVVLMYGIIMLVASIVQVAGQIWAVYLAADCAMGMGRNIRASIMKKVFAFSAREMREFGAPSLITRTTNDVQQIQTLVLMSLAMLVAAPLMMAGGVIMALRSNPQLSLVIAVCVVVLVAGIGLVMVYATPLFKRMQSSIDELNRVVREQLTGIRVIRAFVREPYEAQRFATINGEVRDIGTGIGHTMAMMMPYMFFMMNISQVVLFWYAVTPVNNGQLPIGELTAFTTYLIQILLSVMMSTMLLALLPRAIVSAERIQAVLRTEPSILPPTTPITQLVSPGTLAFDQVTFAYPGAEAPVLQDISFSLQPGETLAVIGSTGSGKSSLVNLVPRLFDVTEGAIRLGGVDVRDLDPALMATTLSIVPQQGYLFSGTIASNLRYGNPDASDEALNRALAIAQAHQFIDDLDHPISQGGTNVSGGQRQRLSIARAIVANPDVYLFDDAFSALDTVTDAHLREALNTQLPGATKVIVAQRVATIKDADHIMVLEAGHIVGFGRHTQLLEQCAQYREIVESQQDAGVGA